MYQPDDELITSRELRARNIGRTEALGKVKALALLPDDVHATTDMVASYFEVDTKTIESVVQRNREELESNGLRVVAGAEFETFKTQVSNFNPRARRAALFVRRTILNIAMLLRDSDIARQVRTYLLDAEDPLPDMSTTDGQITVLSRMLAMAQEKKALELVNANQARELESTRPRAEYVDVFVDPTEDVSKLAVIAGQMGLTEPALRSYLVARNVIKRKLIGYRWSRKNQRREPEYEWLAKAAYVSWFIPKDQPEAPRLHNGQMKTTLYVTPVGKVGIRNLLERHPIDDTEPEED